MSSPGERLRALTDRPATSREEVAAYLDGLSATDRMNAVRSCGGPKIQRRLYELAAGAPPVTVDQLVPPDHAPLREVVYHGKNSLPAFTLFQKRFCRPTPDTASDTLWGYNHTNIAWIVGPGYFLFHPIDGGAPAIDYRFVPPAHPAGWPDVRPNDRGASFFVYRNMVDYLRRVSQHVLIGSATRDGKELGNYFLLCREP
jgi:hypothetical protein